MYNYKTMDSNDKVAKCLDTIKNFFKSLKVNGIIAKQKYTCCNTCGTDKIYTDCNLDYDGYVFYHIQEHDSIIERINDHQFTHTEVKYTEVKVYLAWGIFKDCVTDDEYSKFADRIKKIGRYNSPNNQFNIRIEGGKG